MKNPNLAEILILVVFLALPLVCNGQNAKSVRPFNASDYSANTTVSKHEPPIFSSLIVLNIAIDNFKAADALNSVKSLKKMKAVCKMYMPKTYKNVKYINHCKNGTVNKGDIINSLKDVDNSSDSNTVVMSTISSHGEKIGNSYYLITSDTSRDSNENIDTATAVSGKEFCKLVANISKTAARVIIFVDTCFAEGIYAEFDSEIKSHNIKNKNTYWIAVTGSDSATIEENYGSEFSTSLISTLKGRNEDPFEKDKNGKLIYLSFSSLHSFMQKDSVKAKPNKVEADLDFVLMNYVDPSTYFETKSLLPWKVSESGRGLDYAMIGIESASAVAFLACLGTEVYCKKRLAAYSSDDEVYGYELDKIRKTGKGASVGCWVSAAGFLSSYLIRTFHVGFETRRLSRGGPGDKNKNMSLTPASSSDMPVGLRLTYNF